MELGDDAVAGGLSAPARFAPARPGKGRFVFLFFSNRMGCFGSLIVSALVTLVLLVALGVLDL